MTNGQQRSKIDMLLTKCKKLIGGNQSENILCLSSLVSLENCKFRYKLKKKTYYQQVCKNVLLLTIKVFHL